jgi:hypothetical protein
LRTAAHGLDWLDYRGSYWSEGSCSAGWYDANWSAEHDPEWRRAGLVTANPFSGRDGGRAAAASRGTLPLSARELPHLDECWRDLWREEAGLTTVPPGEVTGRAMWAWARRGRLGFNRLVVHYMQPHMPFRSRPDLFDGWGGTGRFGDPDRQLDDDVFRKLREGEVGRRELREAYEDNLSWVLDEVKRWRDETGARILVTSDHGNGFGDWGVYGHPPGCAAPAVRRVPEAYVEGRAERPPEPGDPPGDPPENAGGGPETGMLEALGYR